MLFFDIVDQEVQNTLQARSRTGLRLRRVWTDFGRILYLFRRQQRFDNMVAFRIWVISRL